MSGTLLHTISLLNLARFWIYGGGFMLGTAASALYDGSYLAANKDIIIVTFNYRVNGEHSLWNEIELTDAHGL